MPSNRPQRSRTPGPAASSAHPRLIEPAAARRQAQINGPGPGVAGDRRIDDVGPHHHAGPAAERRVVDGAVLIAREIADVHRLQPPEAFRQGLAGERMAERPREHLGEDRQHGRGPGRSHGQALSACFGSVEQSFGQRDDEPAAGDVDYAARSRR